MRHAFGERIAHALLQHTEADVCVDVHSGAPHVRELPQVRAPIAGRELELARAMGLPVVWRRHGDALDATGLVGAIVGELPTGAVAGIGSKLLAGSYYSQTIDIWAALIAGSLLAALLIMIVSIAAKIVKKYTEYCGLCAAEGAEAKAK